MGNVINITVSGVKCDTDGCDYRDDSVQLKDYEQWINKPCPKCQANLLTEADYQTIQTVLEVTAEINDLGPELLATFGLDDSDERVRLQLEMDGTGTFTVKE